jgi:hypothetical protein
VNFVVYPVVFEQLTSCICIANATCTTHFLHTGNTQAETHFTAHPRLHLGHRCLYRCFDQLRSHFDCAFIKQRGKIDRFA